MTLGYDIKSGEVTDSSGVIYNINTGEISVVIDGNVSNGGGSGGASTTYGLETLVGQVDESGVMRLPNPRSAILTFTGVKDIESGLGSGQLWYSNAIKEVNFPDLETLSYRYALSQAFENCSYIEKASFPKLKSVTGQSAFSRAFYYNIKLASVDFSNLETISGSDSFANAFYYCKAISVIYFPKLTSVSSNSFNSDTFYCPELTEIHFRADVQAQIEATTGYSKRWGATNATIYFDL